MTAAAAVPAHILVVDDDEAIREMLTEYLRQNELRVTAVPDGNGMLATLSGSVVDLVVLDLKLAGEDGLMLARRLHEQFSIPVVIVSGCTDTADRVMGLELGADDYVTKPFSLRELLARIHVVLRRRRPKARDARPDGLRAFRFGEWELSLNTRRLAAAGGRVVALSKTEFGLLVVLLQAGERVLSREQLLELSRLHVDDVFDRAVDIQVLRLRRKLEPDPGDPKYIRTERGVGYFFGVPVEAVY